MQQNGVDNVYNLGLILFRDLVSISLISSFHLMKLYYFAIARGELFATKFKKTVGKNIQKKLCAYAIRESVLKIARKVAEGVIDCAMALQIAALHCICAMLLKTKNCKTAFVTLCNFLNNLLQG